MSELVEEIKKMREKIQALELRSGSEDVDAKIKALSDRLEALEEKQKRFVEDTDFEEW